MSKTSNPNDNPEPDYGPLIENMHTNTKLMEMSPRLQQALNWGRPTIRYGELSTKLSNPQFTKSLVQKLDPAVTKGYRRFVFDQCKPVSTLGNVGR